MAYVEHFHQEASSATLVAHVFKPDYSEREFSITLSDVGHLGLYTGSCTTIAAGDLVQIYDSSITKYIGAYRYEPNTVPSAATIADAVWDEAVSGHTTTTTFGGKNQVAVPSSTIADYKATGFATSAKQDSMETTLNDIPSTAEFEARTLPSADYVVVTDTIAGVTLVTTCTTNTDLAAVKTQTDKMNFTGTDIKATLDSEKVTVSAVDSTVGLTAQQKIDAFTVNGAAISDAMLATAANVAALATAANLSTVDTVVDAIKVKTDQLAFTANTVDANIATGGLGTGSETVDYYVFTNETSETGAIANVSVYATSDEAGTTVVASGMTNDDGKVTFYLAAGTYYMWRSKAGYSFDNPDTEIVS